MDKNIACKACGTSFVFTQEEQDFYESKGFSEPGKCKPCRDAAKQARGGGSRGGFGGGSRSGGYGGGTREMFDAVCAGCGVQTQVPFQPNGSKPVYCRDCFQASRSNNYAY